MRPLTQELWDRIEDVLDKLLSLPPAKRQAALEAACGDDRDMRRELESLLAVEPDVEEPAPVVSLRSDPDETPALPLAAEPAQRPAPDEPPGGSVKGRRIGPYRLERLLGRGGMGAVYLASRVDEFEMRQVALKVLKRELSVGEMAQRFEHERRILAHLDHPNIAKLLDGGTTEDGVPYFVMDYVEGEPIDRYCRRHRLGIRERLELFRKVCSAVHVAHQNLVVHRDLKPANILVGTDGEPKLLDFGIAKPLDAAGAQASVLTAAGVQPMTLAYASPEQVAGEAVTTASDVYALGVVLYELLTGHPPYRTPSKRWLDLVQAIQTQQPKKPSTMVAVEPPPRPGEVLEVETPGSERGRGARRLLAGDLDQIVLAALAKDPKRRYPSAEQLSADIRRHLEGLPITARKLTFAYWMGKFVRRHKVETALVALVLAAILGFSIVAWKLRDRAVFEQQVAEQVAAFLVDLFSASHPNKAKGEEISAREILDRGRQQIKRFRGVQPRLYARLALTMARVYYDLGAYREAQALLEDALDDLGRQLSGEIDPLLASLNNDLAAVFYTQGSLAAAEERFGEALRIKVELYGEESIEVVDTLNNLATMAQMRGALEEAKKRHLRVIDTLSRITPAVPEQVARSHFLLGTLLLDLRGFEAAETHLRESLSMRRELYGTDDTKVAVALTNLGIALHAQGKTGESEACFRESLEIKRKLFGDQHPEVAVTETLLASLLVTLGDRTEAEVLARKALAILRGSKPGHWRVAHAQSVLGSALTGPGSLAEAEPLLIESHRTLLETKTECDRYVVDASARLIDFYDALGKFAAADAYRAKIADCDTSP